MDEPDTAIVYFSPETIAHKKLNPFTKEKSIHLLEERIY